MECHFFFLKCICSNGRYCHPILFLFASCPFHMCPIITFLFLFSRRVQHLHINLSRILLFIAALLNELNWMVTPQPLKSKTAATIVRGPKILFGDQKRGDEAFYRGNKINVILIGGPSMILRTGGYSLNRYDY